MTRRIGAIQFVLRRVVDKSGIGFPANSKCEAQIVTTLLKRAFSEASRLPEIEQNALARWLIDEIESDRKWETAFAESEDVLAELAREALEEEDLKDLRAAKSEEKHAPGTPLADVREELGI